MIFPQSIFLICHFLKSDLEKAITLLKGANTEESFQIDINGLSAAHFQSVEKISSFSLTFQRPLTVFLCGMMYGCIAFHGQDAFTTALSLVTCIFLIGGTLGLLAVPSTTMRQFQRRIIELRCDESQLVKLLLFKIDINMSYGAIKLYNTEITTPKAYSITLRLIMLVAIIHVLIKSPLAMIT